MLRICALAACLCAITAIGAEAQDQTIILEEPLHACGAPGDVASATLKENQAAAVIKLALSGRDPDPSTYYIIHMTEFAPGHNTIAEANWYVYHAGWEKRPWYWRFTDSRRAKRFFETRIMGSSKVGLVYVYVNVPAYATLQSRTLIANHFRRAHANDLVVPADTTAQQARRVQLQQLTERLQGGLPDENETRAKAAMSAAQANKSAAADPVVELIVQLETERYLQAFAKGDKTIKDEVSLIDQDTGEDLVGLSPTLATSATFAALDTLFHRVDVTKKTPANIQNLKDAIEFAFAGQSAATTPLYVKVETTSVCAGGHLNVKYVPSNLLVTELTRNEKKESVERSKQPFDNEGRYWWDISFALPLDLRRDLSIDVDAGQVAAKEVERGDLFAVVNLGMRRDTKKVQWQLPTFIYGIPITGQPLKHHLLGFTVGLNYLQLLGGWRFDRKEVVATTVENGITVGVETSPPGEKWEHQWVWGINIPVASVVKLFTKDGKK